MAIAAKPGQTVTITVTKVPHAAAAKKTLSRVFLFDLTNRRHADHTPKPILDWRGWGGRVKPLRIRGSVLRLPAIGQSCSFVASMSNIKDLASIERFVSVAAK